jgi:FAD:protein FMN transferase
MKQTRLLMGMPVTVEIVDAAQDDPLFEQVFAYFEYVDEKFSTYKEQSEISLINRGALALEEASYDMRTVFALAESMRERTDGYFDIRCTGGYDPSGLVKGWAISNAAEILRQAGRENFYVEAGGDFQIAGTNANGKPWRVGIRSPFQVEEIVKVLAIGDGAVATSGTYIRGQHIYNPLDRGQAIMDVVSMTVVGTDIYTADCYATAAFAMGRAGIGFLESLVGFEGYMIDAERQATFTSGFSRYVFHDEAH